MSEPTLSRESRPYAARPEGAEAVLIPVPWEATGPPVGTGRAPAAILAASDRMSPLHRTLGRPDSRGIAALEVSEDVREWSQEARRWAQPVRDGAADAELPGCLERVEALGDRLNEWVYAESRRWIGSGKLAAVVGGDQSAAFGLIRAAAETHAGLGVLHVDARPDLGPRSEPFRWSRRSIIRNALKEIPEVAGVIQVGLRELDESEAEEMDRHPRRLRGHFEADLRAELLGGEVFTHLAKRIVADLPGTVYISFDVTGLDHSLCPHAAAPLPGGLSFAEAEALLRAVVESGRRIVGFDLSEVGAPSSDEGGWDALVGARLLYALVGYALRSRESGTRA
jgi:agmatinase